ncbi:hydroxypyruvate isomerase family protein [Sciscionella sediminilitoris]|uniref:hydroxypyruvate isomerase family protein n=1 Tax=Sciscionella sediminilitoris TaxID=1445613 RepID=UPI0004DF67DA|nr:TIM barrel protein [Sciscionella sp. SE31]
MIEFDANLKWLYTELPFLDRFAAAAADGFRGVEIADPYGYEPQTIRKALSSARLVLVLVNTPAGAPGSPTANGAAGVPGEEAAFRDGFRRAHEYAVTLGASLIHVMAGLVPVDRTRRAAAATLARNIEWALSHSDPSITLAVEAINRVDQPRMAWDDLEHAIETVELFEDDRLGILFDVYHAQRSGGNLLERLHAAAPQIKHVQVADSPLRHEPGTGEISWKAVFERLDRIGYDRWIGCEYQPAAGTVAGLGWRNNVDLIGGIR